MSLAFAVTVVVPETVAPEVGAVIDTVGGVESPVTVKLIPLLEAPLTITTTFPDVAPLGTGATILELLQLLGVAAIPLNFTVLVPCEEPKFAPLMVTEVPMAPELGLKLEIFGGALVIVKLTPLLLTPPTVTTIFPVVAPLGTGTTPLEGPQLVGVALVPLNFTVLVPCDEPKLLPLMVTDVPTVPEFGLTLVMLGALEAPLPGLKAATMAPHGSAAARLAVADTAPAAA